MSQDMLSAARDILMRAWILKVPTKNIGIMSLFAISDLPFLLTFKSRQWLLNMIQLREFQRNLSERRWASLAQVYPRCMMWIYIYQLFTWGNYCDVLPDILRCPDKSLLAEVFLCYFCQIDRIIDSYDGRRILVNTPERIKNLPEVRVIATEFLQRLGKLDIPVQTKKSIIRLVANYRREALNASKHWSEQPSDCLTGVVAGKEKTVGNMIYVWSRLLGYLYQVPRVLADNTSAVFFNFAMAVQFIDDLCDAAEDYKTDTQNLFLALARQNSGEWEDLIKYLETSTRNFIDWRWLRVHTPRSYSETRKLHEIYIVNMHRLCRADLVPQLSALLSGMGKLTGYEPLSGE